MVDPSGCGRYPSLILFACPAPYVEVRKISGLPVIHGDYNRWSAWKRSTVLVANYTPKHFLDITITTISEMPTYCKISPECGNLDLLTFWILHDVKTYLPATNKAFAPVHVLPLPHFGVPVSYSGSGVGIGRKEKENSPVTAQFRLWIIRLCRCSAEESMCTALML